eukprot:5673321-Pyramimonas_sp.AAC.1
MSAASARALTMSCGVMPVAAWSYCCLALMLVRYRLADRLLQRAARRNCLARFFRCLACDVHLAWVALRLLLPMVVSHP